MFGIFWPHVPMSTEIGLQQVRFGGCLKLISQKFALTSAFSSSVTSIQVLTSHGFTLASLNRPLLSIKISWLDTETKYYKS
jgi:hypothetical protein